MPLAETPLDVLVIATHPDDAEIGVGGTIVRSVRGGLRVGILDLTDGEPTPHGSPERRAAETSAASKALGLAWRKNLGLPNRSLQDTLEARRQLAGVLRQTRPALCLCPLLGRLASRPRRRQPAVRGRPLLGQAHAKRPARRALLAAPALLLLEHPPPHPSEARLRARHQRLHRAENGSRPRLREPVSRRPPAGLSRPHSTTSATGPATGAGPSAPPTPNRSAPAKRSASKVSTASSSEEIGLFDSPKSAPPPQKKPLRAKPNDSAPIFLWHPLPALEDF